MAGYRTKETLQGIAREHGVELDLTRRHADLVAEVDALVEASKSATAAPDPEPEPETPQTKVVFRSVLTGRIFPYNKIFEGNTDLEKIEVPIEG
jgi:hypothetical protein